MIAVKTKLIPIAPFHKWAEVHYPDIDLPEYEEMPSMLTFEKKSYSVPEVRAILGMKKTTSYELIKAGTLETIIVNKHIRIKKDSFDTWLHSQDALFELKKEENIYG